MTSINYGLIGIAEDVELGKDGPRIKVNGTAVEMRNLDDTDFAILRAAHPVDENDLVTKKYLETRAHVIVTGQIDGGSPPSAGTPGRIYICTTAGGTYTLKYLYYDNGTTWEEIIPHEGMVIKVTDDLTGGTDEYIGDHLYLWDADGSTWVDMGPSPAVAEVVKNARITIAHTDTGVNLIKTVPANAILTQTKCNVTQAFDGTSPELEIGDTADPDRHMRAQDQKLGKVGLYMTENLYLYGSSTAVNATLTIGGTPSQGQALVYIEYAIA